LIIIEAINISRVFNIGQRDIVALSPLSLKLQMGEFLVISGASGSGKSTLLNMLSGLDRPSGGDIFYRQQLLEDFNDKELAQLRNTSFGFVFQTPHTLPDKTVMENVALPFQYGPPSISTDIGDRVYRLLQYVGLDDLAERFPNTLSVGELQRLVFARALVMDPDVIFADEPTGSLDADNSSRIVELLRDQARRNRTIVMVTHDPRSIGVGTRHLQLDKYI